MTASPDQTTLAQDLQPLLDKVVAAGAPGVLTQIQTPSQTLSVTSGVADRDTGARMKPDLHFRIASSAKSFVATVILQLVGERRVKLEDRVSRWVPWPTGAPPECQAITVHQLLNHTSGLFNFTEDEGWLLLALAGKAFDPRDLVSIATTKHPLNFTPGTGCRYSNTDYIVAGLIIEKVTGHSLGDELDARVFRPLRLRHTTFATSPRMPIPHSKGYSFTSRFGYTDLTEQVHPSAYWAAGAIVSNAADLGRFFRELLGGRLLRPELLKAMKETVVTDNGVELGLGIAKEVSQCGHMWGHGGTALGYDTVKACSSEDGTRSAVLMTNVFPWPDAVLEPLINATVAVMCHALQDRMPAAAGTVTPELLTPIIGNWSGHTEIFEQALGSNLPEIPAPASS